MFENLKNKNRERFKDDVPKNVSAKKIREQNEETYDELARIIPSIQEGVSPISIKPTTPLTELNALPNAVYRAFGEGTYKFNPALQIVQGSAVNVIPPGYSVKFLKDANGWSVSVVEKLPSYDDTNLVNRVANVESSNTQFQNNVNQRIDDLETEQQYFIENFAVEVDQEFDENSENAQSGVGISDLLLPLKKDLESEGTIRLTDYIDLVAENFSTIEKGIVTSSNTVNYEYGYISSFSRTLRNIDVTNYNRLYYRAIKPQTTSAVSRFIIGRNRENTANLLSFDVQRFYVNPPIYDEGYIDISDITYLSLSWQESYGVSPIFWLYNEGDAINSARENFLSDRIAKIESVLKTYVSDEFKEVSDTEIIDVGLFSQTKRVLTSKYTLETFDRASTIHKYNCENFTQLYFKGVRYSTTKIDFYREHASMMGVGYDDDVHYILYPQLDANGKPVEEFIIDVSNFKTISICYDTTTGILPTIELRNVISKDVEDYIYKNIGKSKGDNGDNTTNNIIDLTIKEKQKELLAVGRNSAWDFSTKPLRFLHYSDLHKQEPRGKAFVEFLNKLNVDFGVCTGDLSNSVGSEDLSWYWPIMNNAKKPIYHVTGNHDFISPKESFVNKFFGQEFTEISGVKTTEPYYYIDRHAEKVRLIFLCEYETSGSTTGNMTKTQLDWFANTLKSTPNGYGVVIAKHATATNVDRTEFPNWNNNRNWGVGFRLEPIVQAFIDKIVFPQSTIGGVVVNSVDFTSVNASTHFITYINGHDHFDKLGFLTDYPKQLNITIDCAWTKDEVSDLFRGSGDISENCINHITINTQKKTISIIRLGADTTYDLKKRTSLTIKYNR